MLKPGGRFAVCISAITKDLEAGVHWPLCMRMFAELGSLQPAVEAAGLIDVKIDDSDSLMAFELPGYDEEAAAPRRDETESDEAAEKRTEEDVAAAAAKPSRNRVHVGSAEFRHLRDFDLNSICARVVVTGRKAPA